MRVSSIIRRASTWLSGGRLTEKSASPSARTPPVPNTMTEPNCWSFFMPRISS